MFECKCCFETFEQRIIGVEKQEEFLEKKNIFNSSITGLQAIYINRGGNE